MDAVHPHTSGNVSDSLNLVVIHVVHSLGVKPMESVHALPFSFVNHFTSAVDDPLLGTVHFNFRSLSMPVLIVPLKISTALFLSFLCMSPKIHNFHISILFCVLEVLLPSDHEALTF